jgi:hypothetical protein
MDHHVPLAFHSGREADHSHPLQCRGQRMGGAVPPLPQDAFMAEGQLYLTFKALLFVKIEIDFHFRYRLPLMPIIYTIMNHGSSHNE